LSSSLWITLEKILQPLISGWDCTQVELRLVF
jgi:hypothetical protein